MFFKIFNWLIKKNTPYCLAVIIPGTVFAFLAGFFGGNLVMNTASLKSNPLLFGILIFSMSAVILLSWIEIGFLRIFGKKWESREEFKILNENIEYGHFHENVSDEILIKSFTAFKKIEKSIIKISDFYVSMVIFIFLISVYCYSDNDVVSANFFITLLSGIISFFMLRVPVIVLYETLLESARRECKELLSKRNIPFEDYSLSTLKSKFNSFIFLMIFLATIIFIFIPKLPLFVLQSFIIGFLVIILGMNLVISFIDKNFSQIRNSVKDLAREKETSFYSGSADKEIIDLSKDLTVSALKLRTAKKELEKKVAELEKWYKLTVGRELRMVELKTEIKKLEEDLQEKNKNKS